MEVIYRKNADFDISAIGKFQAICRKIGYMLHQYFGILPLGIGNITLQVMSKHTASGIFYTFHRALCQRIRKIPLVCRTHLISCKIITVALVTDYAMLDYFDHVGSQNAINIRADKSQQSILKQIAQ